MSEWWTYRLPDFLMFAPRTYYRLFELYNGEVWPGHLLGLSLGAAVLRVSRQARIWVTPAAWVALAACWFWVAWAFLLQRYADINWAARWYAAGFAIEGGLLLLFSGFSARLRAAGGHAGIGLAPGMPRALGCALAIFALAVQPWIGMLLGRPWRQAEVFGLAPDPTALATLGLLLIMRPAAAPGSQLELASGLVWMLWPIPVLWCLVSGATLWTMAAPEAMLMPCAALLAALAAWRGKAFKLDNLRRA